jgi:hypothetical protein
MTEPLTADELAEMQAILSSDRVMLPGEKFRNLLDAAREAQRLRAVIEMERKQWGKMCDDCVRAVDKLRAAIQKHEDWKTMRRPGEVVAEDRELWEALK